MARPGAEKRRMARVNNKRYGSSKKEASLLMDLIFLPVTLPFKLLFGKKKHRKR